MNVAIYARVSTADQSISMQLDELRQYCLTRGWTIVHEYLDKGVSGAKASRPQLDRMMAAAAKKEFDVVLVWKLDRFGRSLAHLTSVIALLESYGVAFASARDQIDLTTAAGRLMFGVLGAMSQFERDLIKERTRAGMAAAARRGVHCGRQAIDIDAAEVARLRASGHSWERVSDVFAVSVSTVKRAVRQSSELAAV